MQIGVQRMRPAARGLLVPRRPLAVLLRQYPRAAARAAALHPKRSASRSARRQERSPWPQRTAWPSKTTSRHERL
eukprot:scaffold170391_cov30-Tisochrysis_lutea.AAC.2